MTTPAHESPRFAIIVSWTLVLVPLAWGVYQSVMKSLPLFQASTVSKKS